MYLGQFRYLPGRVAPGDFHSQRLALAALHLGRPCVRRPALQHPADVTAALTGETSAVSRAYRSLSLWTPRLQRGRSAGIGQLSPEPRSPATEPPAGCAPDRLSGSPAGDLEQRIGSEWRASFSSIPETGFSRPEADGALTWAAGTRSESLMFRDRRDLVS